MLNFKGNTAMYLIYAYVRIRAVFRRAENEGVPLPKFSEGVEIAPAAELSLSEAERALSVRLLLCPEVHFIS